MGKNDRLQKIIANSGALSRRKAEEAIQEGRVKVDDQVVTEMGIKLDPADHIIEVDGQVLKTDSGRETLILNKPTRCMTTKHDPEGRRTVMDLLPANKAHLNPVGRLDFQTEGLLLMSNDGELTLTLTHPRYGIEKEYIAVINGQLTPAMQGQLTHGIGLEDGVGRFRSVKVLRDAPKRSRLKIVVEEGRNRFVRRMLEFFELEVLELKRIRVGSISLGSLRPTEWRVVTDDELKALLENTRNEEQ